MHTDRPQMVNHDFLHIDVLESVRIVYQLSLVVYPFLVALKGTGPSAI